MAVYSKNRHVTWWTDKPPPHPKRAWVKDLTGFMVPRVRCDTCVDVGQGSSGFRGDLSGLGKNLPHRLGFLVAVDDIFFEELNLPALEECPHGSFIKEAFGTRAYLMKIGLNLGFSGRRTIMKIIGGVETGEQDAVRFEAALEFGGDL